MRRNKLDGAYRLAKLDKQSDFEFREYGVKRIRRKARAAAWLYLYAYDWPDRTFQRSWKVHRKTQYK